MKLPRPTSEQIEQLRQRILECESSAVTLAEATARRVSLCLEVGTTLMQWKTSFRAGTWMDFLSTEFSIVPYRTIVRWMQLAELSEKNVINVAECRSLKQAFELCGVSPARNPPEQRKMEPKQKRLAHQYLQHLNRLLAALSELKTASMDQSSKNEVRRRLAPIVKFYEGLESLLPQRKLAA